MKREHVWQTSRKKRPLRNIEALEPRILLAVDAWVFDLSGRGELDLFGATGGGDVQAEFAQSGRSAGEVISTRNVPGQNNPLPIAVDDAFTTDEATSFVGENVLVANPSAPDRDPEGESIAVFAVNGDRSNLGVQTRIPSGAWITVSQDGTFDYDPNGAFEFVAENSSTDDQFSYSISDSVGGVSSATVTVAVTGINDVPTATNLNQSRNYNEDSPNVPFSDIQVADPDLGDIMTATLSLSNPSAGVLTTASGNGETYTPVAGEWRIRGPLQAVNAALREVTFVPANDSFVDLTIATRVRDQAATGPADGVISLQGNLVNDAPGFTKGADPTVAEGSGPQTVNSWATAIRPGPLDEAGQNLVFNVTSNTNASLFAAGPSVDAAGNLTYTPAADAAGSAVITLELTDDGGTANGGNDTSAPQTFTITIADINDAPSFSKGADQSVLEDAGVQTVTGWATAISAGPANESSQNPSFNVTGNTNSSLFALGPSVDAAGNLTFTPAVDATGSAVITLELTDDGGTANGGNDTSLSQSFTITISDVNDAPSFTQGADQTVVENAGSQTINGWATAISAGPANESSQNLTFNITGNTDGGLFLVGPAVDTAGNLTYTSAAGVTGSAVITLELVDDGGTANGGSDTSSPQSFTITVTQVNAAPSFTAGSDQTVSEDVGPQTVNGWATGIIAGPPSESSQNLTFNITNNTNSSLFLAGPAVDAAGNLTYVPAADAAGSAVITLELMDDGGTVNGGIDTSPPQSFTITVTDVNDAPSFTKGPNQTVLEDSGPQAVNGWATAVGTGPANESSQNLTFNVTGNTNSSLFLAGPAVDAAGNLTYVPAADAAGSAVITLELMDDGGTANGGIDTSPSQSFTITVTGVNDAPSFTKGADQSALEDAGMQTVNGWATAISTGPANESSQNLTFNITGNTNSSLFAAGPAVDASGNLTYTPATDAAGSAVITLELTDDGGTANGGNDTSPSQSFTITISEVNDAPSFTQGADQTVVENAGSQTINGWATAISAGPANESSQNLTFNITGNTDGGLFLVGPAVDTAGNLTYTSAAGVTGSAVITLELVDDGGTANGGSDTSSPQSFTITVTQVNAAPSFTAGSDQTVSEDVGPQTVNGWATGISAGPPSESSQNLTFNVTNNTNSSLFLAGPAVDAAGNLTYVPAADAAGSAVITLELMDDGGTVNGGIDTSPPQSFTITVTDVNDAPSFTKGPNQTVLEDSGPQAVNGWATAVGTGPANESSQNLTFNVTGNTNSSLFLAGPAVDAAGNLTYVPAAGAAGSAVITLELMDDGGTANGGIDTSPSQSFTITVTGVNDAPSFTKGADQSALEDAGMQTVNGWATAISTGPANESSQNLTFNITGNTNNSLFAAGPAVDAAGNLTYTPATDAAGSAVITLELTDDGGTANGGNDTSLSQSFTITISEVNDAPSFTQGADQTVVENAGSQTINGWATAISAGPANESSQNLTFNITGNTNGALFLVSPAVDTAGNLTYTSAASVTGSAVITLELVDDGGTANGGSDTSSPQSFTITVTEVNAAPSFTAGSDQTVSEDVGPQTVNGWATGIIAGPPSESSQNLTFNVTNNTNSSLFLAGPAVDAAGNLTYVPAADAAGSAVITLELMDDGGTANGGIDTSPSQSFTITVTGVNDAPSFTQGADQSVLEDAGMQTVNGWATAISTGPANESSQNLTFNITNNTNSSLFLAGPAVDAAGNLTYVPAADVAGSAVIALELMDDGGTASGGVDTSPSQSFTITVTGVNDAPSFTKGADQSALEDAGMQTVNGWATAISTGPPNESSQNLTFNITGNTNNSLFAAGPAVDASGNLTYTPAADATGSAVITLELMDDGGTASGGSDTSSPQSFTITVTQVNAAPSFTAGSDQTVSEDVGPQTVNGWATGIIAGPPSESSQNLTFNVTNNTNSSLFLAGPAVDAAGNLTYVPAADAAGSAVITLELMDDGGTANGGIDTSPSQSFTITVTGVNDAPSFTKGADQSVLEDAGMQTVNGWATAISTGPPNESSQNLTFNVTGNTNSSLFAAGPAVNAVGNLTYVPAADAAGSAVITLELMDDGGTANGGIDTSPPQSFTISVTGVNDAPSFTKGADQSVLEDAGMQTVNGWATAISTGPANESSQNLTFNVTGNTNSSLFAVGPAVDAAGNLTYVPAADAAGSAVITLELMDDGGTANGGVDTSPSQSFTVSITSVNDAPSFTKGADQVISSSAGAQTIAGWATMIEPGPADEAGQTLSFNVTNNSNPGLFTVGPAVDAAGTLSFTPVGGVTGSADITLEVSDDGGTSNGGQDTSSPRTFTITFPALQIIVGDHNLLANTPNQTISIFVTGGELVQGVNFQAQVADGGPGGGGAVVGPAIQSIDMLTGTIFASNNNGPGSDLDGPHVDVVPQWESRNVTTAAGDVLTSDLLAVITFDTTEFSSGTWPLILSNTVGGPTDFPANNPPTFTRVPIVVDGSITVS